MELDEEDSHLCIRCNQTIIGLQNYVNHRQSQCRAQAKSSSKQFSPNFSFLDSHTNKKIQSYEDDFNFGDDESDDDDDEEEDDVGISVEQNNKSTESEYKEYDYDFFSSLELQCMSTKRDIPQARGGKNFNHHHRIMTRKATAAIMAQNGDEWIDDTNVVGINKKEDEDAFNKYYQNESNESTDTDESEPAAVPPRNYTRGKWKPGSRISNNFVGKWKAENWDLNENESSNDALDKSYQIDDTNPPPSHTKGKWIPGTKISRLEFKDEKIDEKTERDSFWCRYCCRNLATKPIYERHLKSNLHKKRTKQQNELEDAGESLPLRNLNELSTHFDNKEQQQQQKTPEERNKISSTTVIPSKKRMADENTEIIEIESEIHDRGTISTPITRTSHDNDDDDDDFVVDGRNVYRSSASEPEDINVAKRIIKRKKKFRSRTKITCEECDMKLPVHLFGNHLISHFHYRKMLLNPKKSFDSVLNNFHKIVIQSPFQCQPCKFYFNTREEFTRHWNSIEHTETVNKLVGGKFLCSSFCKFECVSNAEMTEHLDSVEHQQVVTLINRSKPIIIRYITRLSCKQCRQEFRYNIQLMHHMKECKFKTTDKFKFNDIFNCDMCDKAFQSGLSLQKHKFISHKISIFFCSKCQLTFDTADEAKLHRRTNQHKTLASHKRILNDPKIKDKLKKKCPICKEEQMDIIQLKQHILDFHPERKFSCGRCGMKFAIAQEISRHVRDKLCKFYNTNKTEQSTTCTITSNKVGDSQTEGKVIVENAETSTSKSFALITSDSIKYPSMTIENDDDDDKVPTPTIESVDDEEESPSQGIDLIENNFSDILSPSAFQISEVRSNETDDDNEYGMIIGEIDNKVEQIVEIQFTCKMCGFSSESHAEFLFHEILHQVPNDQKSTVKLQCSVCKKFFRKQSLREHLRQHTNERIFNCPIQACPMSFTRKANLKNHVRNVHKRSSEPSTSTSSSFVCKICGKKFLSNLRDFFCIFLREIIKKERLRRDGTGCGCR
ncbi:zinc finger protein 33A isoform X3 [Chironomus tepperi]|uniref:zinc finger protein 33A isoform X3 n=1 Tax=Chironomus tepperi TaxID=113505 RepID=UPI00391F98A3